MSIEIKLITVTERIFRFWKVLVLLAVVLFLIIIYNFSANDRYYINSRGLILDKRTGTVYLVKDKIKKDNPRRKAVNLDHYSLTEPAAGLRKVEPGGYVFEDKDPRKAGEGKQQSPHFNQN